MGQKDTGRQIETVILDEFAQRSSVPGYDCLGNSICVGRPLSDNTDPGAFYTMWMLMNGEITL